MLFSRHGKLYLHGRVHTQLSFSLRQPDEQDPTRGSLHLQSRSWPRACQSGILDLCAKVACMYCRYSVIAPHEHDSFKTVHHAHSARRHAYIR